MSQNQKAAWVIKTEKKYIAGIDKGFVYRLSTKQSDAGRFHEKEKAVLVMGCLLGKKFKLVKLVKKTKPPLWDMRAKAPSEQAKIILVNMIQELSHEQIEYLIDQIQEKRWVEWKSL